MFVHFVDYVGQRATRRARSVRETREDADRIAARTGSTDPHDSWQVYRELAEK